MLLHNLNVILQNPYVQHDRADPAVRGSSRAMPSGPTRAKTDADGNTRAS